MEELEVKNKSLPEVSLNDNELELKNKLQDQLSLADEKPKVNQVIENAINVRVAGKALEDENLVKKLVEDKAEILKDKSKADVVVNTKTNEREITEAITEADRAFFKRYEDLLSKVKLTQPCAKRYMQALLFIIIPIQFVVKLISLIINTPFEILKLLLECIDTVCKSLASISKSARIIFISLFSIAVIVAISVFIYNKVNGIT